MVVTFLKGTLKGALENLKRGPDKSNLPSMGWCCMKRLELQGGHQVVQLEEHEAVLHGVQSYQVDPGGVNRLNGES